MINRAGMEKALHATGYPNHKVWGLQEGHSNDKYTADEFIISPAVAGEVYSFARPLLSLMSVESGILHHNGKEHKRADETFNQDTRDLFDKYLHGHTRCQPLNRTGSRLRLSC